MIHFEPMATRRRTTKPKESPSQKFKIERSAGFVSVYANNAQLNISNWDFRITFGETLAAEADGTQVVEQRVAVTMSPQHAKALTGVLGEHIKKYEEIFGEIRWQPIQKAGEANAQT